MTRLRPGGKTLHTEARHSNRRLVLQGIFDEGPLSRADLARSTGLGRATVSEIASDLIAQGLVTDVGPGESTGGKPPTLIELDPNGRFTIAVDLSRRPIEAALLNLRGRIVTRVEGKSLAPRGREATQELHWLISELAGSATASALGIGVGVPGTVSRDGQVLASFDLDWTDVPLRDELQDIYGLPSYVIGDAEAAAVAEFGRVNTDPVGRMLYLKVDDRIAAGVVAGGWLNRTTTHGGDLTHLRVGGWRNECSCGQRGCLGTRVSMINILGPDYLDMSTEARKRLATETTLRMDKAAEYLGKAVAPIVAGLDADLVVVGGEMGDWSTVPAHVARGIESRAGWSPEVAVTRLGPSGVVLGAAAVVLGGELGVMWG